MENILEIKQLDKVFGKLHALEDININIEKGTFNALVGENGAGKSTLAKCIMGQYTPTSGEIIYKNTPLKTHSNRDSLSKGIGMIYQHFMLVEKLTVMENLLMGQSKIPFLISWKKEKEKLQAFMDKMPFHLNLNQKVSELSAGEKQKLEILKMLYLDCELLILDEPTSVLTPDEGEEVLSILKSMVKEKGLTIIIITHKFREIFGFADYVHVLRKGKHVGQAPVKDLDKESLATMMIGEKVIKEKLNVVNFPNPKLKLKINQVTTDSDLSAPLKDLNIELYQGAIYGIAGVSGNGQKTLVDLFAGLEEPTEGSIEINGEPLAVTRKKLHAQKIRCIPEEPLKNACVPNMSVEDNMVLHVFDLEPYAKYGFIQQKKITEYADQRTKEYKVKMPSLQSPISNLSGGNVQRAVLAREISASPEVVIFSNPCFGLDFNATNEIRSRILELRNNGCAILLLSEDLDEIIELSDKIGVIYHGTIVYETTNDKDIDIKLIGKKMAGHE